MTAIGLSLFSITVGAILKYAVTWHVAGIDMTTVGLILIVTGVIGLCVSLWVSLADRSARSRS